MNQKKIPVRRCIVSGERYPKKELIRVVKNKENIVFIDMTGKAHGRGAYIKLDKANINKAKKKKLLNNVFKMEVNENVYAELLSLCK